MHDTISNTGTLTPVLPPSPPAMIALRPYQQECVQRVIAAYARDPQGEELLVLPTAAGKTVIFSQVIARLAEQYGTNALVIAHTDELLNQAAEKYRQVKPTAVIGKVGGGIHQYGGEVTVACIDTISRPHHLANITRMDYGLVVVDESHRSASPKYQRVLEALSGAFVLKVTATPDRLDGKPICAKTPLYSASTLDMIDQGYLCDVRAIAIRTETSLDTLHTGGGDYRERELEAAIDTPQRNRRVVEAYREHASGRRALCFAVTVEHALHLADVFREVGIPAACISGQTPLAERRLRYADLREGALQVLTNVLCLTEGFDLPLVDCIIMARPTRSRALFTQCLGRGLRLAPAKSDCLVLDLTDNCLKHRLEPQRLGTVLGTQMRDGETVRHVLARLREEQEESASSSTPMRRTLTDTRAADLSIALTARLNWREQEQGTFVLEVGQHQHRILLVPDGTDRYRVYAAFAPTYQWQQWLGPTTLDWAQQFAERNARLLLADAKNRVLVDRRAGWRTLSVDLQSKQASWLRTFGVPIPATMTRGEASAILEQLFAERAHERARHRAHPQIHAGRPQQSVKARDEHKG